MLDQGKENFKPFCTTGDGHQGIMTYSPKDIWNVTLKITPLGYMYMILFSSKNQTPHICVHTKIYTRNIRIRNEWNHIISSPFNRINPIQHLRLIWRQNVISNIIFMQFKIVYCNCEIVDPSNRNLSILYQFY